MAILTIALLVTSCGNKCKNEVQLYLPQDFKDCFVFPTGSWWVYTVNGEVYDTLNLTSSSLKPRIEPAENECEYIEKFFSTYSTNHYSFFDSYNFCINYKKSPTYNGDTVYYTFIKPEWYKNINSIETKYIYCRYFGAGLYGLNATYEMEIAEQTEKGGGYCLEALRDTSINNISRKLIVFKTIDYDLLDGFFKAYPDSLPPFRVYYARGVGMIKKEMYNGDIWELKQYFINN